ncbi:MAG: protoporphyrinogen/coproporphyrinogen oxidase [Bacillota bacterium]
MAEVLIIGAGVAGLSAAVHARRAGHEVVIFEAKERWGGLLDHFDLNGFRFDNAVHFGFSKNDDYRAVLEKTDYITHRPEPYNYEQGRWLKHPVQNNLYPLPAEDKVEAIKGFVKRPARRKDAHYGQWLVEQFGQVIAERYPGRYTRKYWTVPAEQLSTDWIGNRLYRPSLDEVLFGAMTGETPSTYYLPEMIYPRGGGYSAFLEPLLEGLDLRTNREVVYIDPLKKYVRCLDGSREYYRHLISSMPLPELAKMIEGAPAAVTETAETLWATSVALVSLGFNTERVADEHLWFYIYDEEILPARAHAPYRKSPANAPQGCSSLQFETYYSRQKPLPCSGGALIEHVIEAAEKMQLASRQDLAVSDFRTLPYGNVVFDQGMAGRRDFVLDYVQKQGILPVGRFGEWAYLWADQCYLSGKKAGNLPFML